MADNTPPETDIDEKKDIVIAETATSSKSEQGEIDNTHEYVKAAVREVDDGEPANTLRAWIIGMSFVTVTSAANMILSMRQPQISIPVVAIMLLTYPIGRLWAATMPTRKFSTFGIPWSLNPGPFNIKEHTVITLCASVTYGYAYSTDALLALNAKALYDHNLGWLFAFLFTISSQLIGIALSGMFRRFLIWPVALTWPSNFSVTALLYALHDRSKTDPTQANGWSISRYRYFCYLATGMFVYYWFPGVLFQALSIFSFPTWIRPNDPVVNQLFGGFTGLSLIPITFDWSNPIGYLGDPLLAPTSSHVNVLIGLIFFVILPAIGISYSGALWSAYLPINTSTTFDNTQSRYNVRKILGDNFSFDEAKYKAYSPVFLAPTFLLNYGLSFAALTASLVHITLHRGKEIVRQFRAGQNQDDDVHLRMIKKYVPAPDWWYSVLLVVTLAMGVATVEGWDTQLPWYGFFAACLLATIFIIPCCTILGIANVQIALNVLSAFIGGLLFPGKPIGVMIFKVYSTIVLGQAQSFCSDLKLAQYMHIPPRITFVAHRHISSVPMAELSSSINMGVIGPKRLFGKHGMYSCLNYFWIVGAALPLLYWIIGRRFKHRLLKGLHAPVQLGAMGWLPPASPISFFSWCYFGLIFNLYLRKKFHGWWTHYNYLTAAALDTGLIICTLVIFFAITFPDVTLPQWWGNVEAFNTMDYNMTAIRKTVADGETFGPKEW